MAVALHCAAPRSFACPQRRSRAASAAFCVPTHRSAAGGAGVAHGVRWRGAACGGMGAVSTTVTAADEGNDNGGGADTSTVDTFRHLKKTTKERQTKYMVHMFLVEHTSFTDKISIKNLKKHILT